MDQLAALWCAISLVIFPLVWSTDFTKARIAENQVANLSSSWINYPKTIINSTLESGRMITPILLRGSDGGTQFLCGFYCPNNQTCYFSVLIFQDKFGIGDGSWQINAPKVVWTANGGRPVKYNATLQLTQSGDMVLADADGTLVWSANTGGKSVSGLNLTEKGNLVLFNRRNAAVWQSFDHPTDCLVPGQVLLQGQKLTSTISTSNFSQGLYSLEVQSQPEEDMHLLSMFKRKEEEGKLYEMVDKYNEDMQSNSQDVIEMMKISVWCLQYDPSRRPSMSVVVKVLEGLLEVNDNLDYDIANVAIPRAIAGQDHHEGVIDAATQLLPSTLSGPR